MKPMPIQPISTAPLVSVLITNYNYASYIDRAIQSVLDQTYQNFEIIVCDDGSMDNSPEIIQRYTTRDRRIKAIIKENGGQASALNAAFYESQGEIVAILDADDFWFPEKLEIVKNAFQADPKAGFVYHPLRIVDGRGNVLRDFPKATALVDGWLMPQNRLVIATASGISLHRSIAQEVFPLPELFRSLADACIIGRSSVIAIVKSIPRTLGIWQQHHQSLTGYGKTSIIDIDRYITATTQVLKDRETFVKRHYPSFKIDCSLWDRQALGLMYCARALYSGQKMRLSEIKLYRPGYRALIWYALMRLPQPLGVLIHKLWASHPGIHSLFSEI